MRSLQERLRTARAAQQDEGTVERHLQRQVKDMRGLCIKIMLLPGWPDRLVLLPGGKLAFFELKRPKGGVFEPLQERIHDKLRLLGFKVYVCRTKQSVDETLQEVT